MLRITIQESAQGKTLKLEGKLTGPWVGELEQTWSGMTASGTGVPALAVELADVTYIDAAGKCLLKRMHQAGAKLKACSPLNRSIVDEIVRAGKCTVVLLAMVLAMAVGANAQDKAPDTGALRLTLKDAVNMALNQNPQVQIANLNVAQSQEDQKIARAGLLPNASLQSYERTQRLAVAPLFGLQHVPGLPFPGHLGPYQVFQAGPQFSVPIFDLTLWRKWQASKEGVGTSRAQNQGVREQIAMLVVSQYLASLRASADVKAAQSRVELAQALYGQAADLQKNGAGTGIDTLRSNVELQNERQRLIESQTQMATSLYGLSQLLNVAPQREIELADSVSFFDTPVIEVDRSLEAAYSNRPEMKALAHQQRQVELASRQAGDSRYPTLGFDGYWAEQGLAPASAIPVYVYNFSVNLPLFTGGRIGAERARAELELRKVSQQEQEQRNQIALQVRTSAAQLAAARSRSGRRQSSRGTGERGSGGGARSISSRCSEQYRSGDGAGRSGTRERQPDCGAVPV